MHPEFLQVAITDHKSELERRASFAQFQRVRAEPTESTAAVVLRLCSVHDDEALDRLAALEGQPAPTGRHLLAEVDGTVVAALPLGHGRPLADPFRATAHLMPQLAPTSQRRGPAGWGFARSWSRA